MDHRNRLVCHVRLSFLLIFMVVLAVGPAASSTQPKPVISHQIKAAFDIVNHTVTVKDRMEVPAGLEFLRLGAGMNIEVILRSDRAEADPRVVVSEAEDTDGKYQQLSCAAMGLQSTGGFLYLVYSGRFHEPTDQVVFSRENVGGEITATIGDEGIYMSGGSGWLATSPGTMATFDLTVDTPLGFEPVTQGKRIEHEPRGDVLRTRWQAAHPSDGLNLIANRFVVHEKELDDGVNCYTFFMEDDPALRATYEERTAAYIKMYEDMIGPYPYAKFATVENWFPTGYGMPSWTLLGGQVLRLPFIPYTSFGHEICHNWWGNSVFVDPSEGNWCEGLTVYCADYHYKELESAQAAREYRRNLLKDYASYVRDPDHDFPLTQFKSRHSGATRAVGYGKSMMVFHMVDRLIGREAFLAALRQVAADHQYLPATWTDFLDAFTRAGGRDLGFFKAQWLERTGAPTLSLRNVKFHDDRVDFELVQSEPAYTLAVPVVITTPEGDREQIVPMGGPITPVSVPVKGARRLAVDPDCHLFRHLDPAEIEPTLRQILAHDDLVFTCGDHDPVVTAAARKFAASFSESEDPVFSPDGAVPAEAGSAVIINPAAPQRERLLPPGLYVSGKTVVLEGKRYSLDKADLTYAVADPDQPGRTLLVVFCRNPRRLEGLADRLGHYGKYSWLVLPQGRGRVVKGNWPAGASPLVAEKP